MSASKGTVNQTSARPRPAEGAEPPGPTRLTPWPVVKGTLKVMIALFAIYYFVIPLIPGFRKAAHDLQRVNPALIALGFALEIAALLSYSLLTRAALPPNSISIGRLFRIQMSTKALSGVMPAGSAAGSALGYRLLTMSGVAGADAGFALATVGLGSAVVLNFILLLGLLVSIPLRGVNPFYGTAAIIGVVLIALAGTIVVGLLKGQARSERVVRAITKRLRLDSDRAIVLVRHVAGRVRDLFENPKLLMRVGGWAAANWLLDAAALWVFLRAFGGSLSVDGLIISFGLANVIAVVPILPGGLGIMEGVFIPTIVGFGLTRSNAVLGVASYRFAQFWFPLVLGGALYLSLRLGPWQIEREDRLRSLREEAEDASEDDTNSIEWAEVYAPRKPGDETGRIQVPGQP